MFHFFDLSDPFGILPIAGLLIGGAGLAGILYAAIAVSMNGARRLTKGKQK